MAASQPLEGCIIDSRYSVCKRLQSGYFGATWMAMDTKNNYKDVCIKTFYREGSSEDKEMTILKKLRDGHFSHENLCAVLDVSVKRAPITRRDGSIVMRAPYVVFEYCSGTDMFNFIVTGPFERQNKVRNFSESLAAHYFTQASLAIIYLHERGVYHRDIKPENFVLDENFNLKVTDFGTNKFLPVSDDPSELLRTATKGIGTDNYRAPEVNTGVHSYDPSAADIWSLGVTLFFMVGVEEMVAKVQELDQYSRSVLAPLGILFPFPIHCSKLDCYMKTAAELSTMSLPLSNVQFWEEWSKLNERLSLRLRDLFNQIFMLEPSMRITMRDIVRHPWVSKATKLSPNSINRLMKERCPRVASPSVRPKPKALSGKQLGGVDQASLRQSISRHGNSGNTVMEYLSDSELWAFTDTVRQLEAMQLSIVKNDVSVILKNFDVVRQLLKEILTSPNEEEKRSINSSVLESPWMAIFLCKIGFVPHANLLYLPQDSLDPCLFSTALAVISGLEEALTRRAIHAGSSSDGFDVEDEEGQGSDEEGDEEEMVTDAVQLPYDNATGYSESSGFQPVSEDSLMDTFTSTPFYESSQDSNMCWSTAGTSLSTLTSLDESSSAEMDETELARHHSLFRLDKCVVKRGPKPTYRAAKEFCKLSGLLCSYGLYQVVLSKQLCLYCRGNTSEFSARLVLIDQQTGAIGISSWCFSGVEEWTAILERADQDMKPHQP